MRLSELLTTRSEQQNPHDLLACAGYTHRLADGLYSLLPLGQRVLARINHIVRAEFEGLGAQEITMPLLQPLDLWERPIGGRTRAAAFGEQLLRTSAFALAPTHEEVATIVAAACVRETRDLPRTIFQIQPRFRNQEKSVRGTLLRTLEFCMADAYSFHTDRSSLDEVYRAMKNAFQRVARHCGIDAEFVEADTGAIGGDASEELIAPIPQSEVGAAIRCSACQYAASVEIARTARQQPTSEPLLDLQEVAAPELQLPDLSAKRLFWIPFIAGQRVVLAVVTGERRAFNSTKLVNALSRAGIDTTGLHSATARELTDLGADYDCISLVRTPASVIIVADEAVRTGKNFFGPSPRKGHYLINLNCGRDFRVDMVADLFLADDGDLCPNCGSRMQIVHGIEVGHIFKLGSQYTESFGAAFSGPDGKRPLDMGCYGLGVTRMMATIVEQRRDARGIVWPASVAPYLAILVPADDRSRLSAEEMYTSLTRLNASVLLDDSNGSLQNRVDRADLLGIPLQVCFSSDPVNAGTIEVRERASGKRRCIPGDIPKVLEELGGAV
jgi:prolyl-tRNA synthetase